MSITRYEIADCIETGDLCVLEPHAPGAPQIRALLLTQEMQKAILVGPWKTQTEMNRLRGELRADCENFVTNDQRLRVSLGGRELNVEDMKRLQDTEEVWELKSKQKPGIRVFGRFVGHNAFLATHWQWRASLGKYGSKQWSVEIQKCIAIWDNLFSKQTPHLGVSIDDYLSDTEKVGIFYGRRDS